MKECGICYETKLQRFLPCKHSVCHDCYDQLQGDNCPYCRQPFRKKEYPPGTFDPEYWLDYHDTSQWTVYSRFMRNGMEIIRVFRNGQVPESWRNDAMATVVKNRRFRRRRLRRN